MIEEMQKRFVLSNQQIQWLKEIGVFAHDDEQQVIQQISMALTLKKLGYMKKDITKMLFYYLDAENHRSELLFSLRHRRCEIIKRVHKENQRLDIVDHLIDQLRNKESENDQIKGCLKGAK